MKLQSLISTVMQECSHFCKQHQPTEHSTRYIARAGCYSCSFNRCMLKLRACARLANYLNPLAKIVFAILHQACRGIIVADHLHVNVRPGQLLVKS